MKPPIEARTAVDRKVNPVVGGSSPSGRATSPESESGARFLDNLQESRFWSKVQRTSTCWIWTGSRRGSGYGGVRIGGVLYLAHRISYLISIGPIPDGLLVLHRCDVALCVRPDHLYLGSQKQNVHDAIERGRQYLDFWRFAPQVLGGAS